MKKRWMVFGIVFLILLAGINIAKTIYERHTILSQWLITLGVDEEIAAEDACRMEHILSTQSFQAIKALTLNSK